MVLIQLYTVVDNSRGRIRVFNFSEENSAIYKVEEITQQYIGYTNGNYSVEQLKSRHDGDGVIIKNLIKNEEVGRVVLCSNYIDNELVSFKKNRDRFEYANKVSATSPNIRLGRQGKGFATFID